MYNLLRILSLLNPTSHPFFRHVDVGRPKAVTAAEFIMKRVPGCLVTPYYGKIQDKSPDYYDQFTIILCGLDSIEARRWMNATLVGMVDKEDLSTMKPMVDGGTEGSPSFSSPPPRLAEVFLIS